MKTENSSTPTQIEFESVGVRKLVASFDAEHISSDGGVVLLREVDQRFKRELAVSPDDQSRTQRSEFSALRVPVR